MNRIVKMLPWLVPVFMTCGIGYLLYQNYQIQSSIELYQESIAKIDKTKKEVDKKIKETSNNVLDNSTNMLNDLQTFAQIQTDSLNHLNDPLIQAELKSKLEPLVDGQLDKVPVVNIVKISDQYHVEYGYQTSYTAFDTYINVSFTYYHGDTRLYTVFAVYGLNSHKFSSFTPYDTADTYQFGNNGVFDEVRS